LPAGIGFRIDAQAPNGYSSGRRRQSSGGCRLQAGAPFLGNRWKMIPKIIAGFVLASLLATPTQAGDLKLTVMGVRSDAGQLMIGLYDTKANWKDALDNSARVGLLNDKGRLIGVTMRARTGSQSIGFLQLPPGDYAVLVFHDENDNGVLDKGAFGIPTEGYGFSNNAEGFFSAPSWHAAGVTIGTTDDRRISISLIY
jgi:uncharacterized protein (DUF2141 family)